MEQTIVCSIEEGKGVGGNTCFPVLESSESSNAENPGFSGSEPLASDSSLV